MIIEIADNSPDRRCKADGQAGDGCGSTTPTFGDAAAARAGGNCSQDEPEMEPGLDAAEPGAETVWRYDPFMRKNIGIRFDPAIVTEKTDHELIPGQVFRVSAEKEGDKGVIFLKLADGKGWVFDRLPGPSGGIMCIRTDFTVWRYEPPFRKKMGIRVEPLLSAEKTGQELMPMTAFQVTKELAGDDGITYLKLADGRGWAFDRLANGNVMCLRSEEDRTPTHLYMRDTALRQCRGAAVVLEPPAQRSRKRPRVACAPSIWRFEPFIRRNICLRVEPRIDGKKAGDAELVPGSVFRVSQMLEGEDGVIYLKLADGRGWVFDMLPGRGTMCERCVGDEWEALADRPARTQVPSAEPPLEAELRRRRPPLPPAPEQAVLPIGAQPRKKASTQRAVPEASGSPRRAEPTPPGDGLTSSAEHAGMIWDGELQCWLPPAPEDLADEEGAEASAPSGEAGAEEAASQDAASEGPRGVWDEDLSCWLPPPPDNAEAEEAADADMLWDDDLGCWMPPPPDLEDTATDQVALQPGPFKDPKPSRPGGSSPEEAGSRETASAEQTQDLFSGAGAGPSQSVWRYEPFLQKNLGLRCGPSLSSPKTDVELEPGHVFRVSAELVGAGGIVFLQLADGVGWCFDRILDQGTMCVRLSPEERAAFDEGLSDSDDGGEDPRPSRKRRLRMRRPSRKMTAAVKIWPHDYPEISPGLLDVYSGRPDIFMKYRPPVKDGELCLWAAPVSTVDEAIRVLAEDTLHAGFDTEGDVNGGSLSSITELLGLRPKTGHPALRSGRRPPRSMPYVRDRWLLWETISEELVSAAVLQRQCNTSSSPRWLREGAILEYIASLPGKGAKAHLLVAAAEELCRSLGYAELFSAADLTQKGQAFGGKATGALVAHRRWGFIDMDKEEWQERRFHEYTGDSSVKFMVKPIPPRA